MSADTLIRILLFATGSAVLAWLSRASLRAARSHGFYRFLAWECILALALAAFVDLRQWFADPLSARQLVSWLLLFGSIVPVGLGTYLLRARGRPDPRRSGDPSLLAFERTTQLVTTGVFRYIRHPMYSSLLLLAWGIFFKRPGWVSAVLAVLATLFLAATARAEEAEDVRYFGSAYEAYIRSTRRFIPFVY